MTMTEPVPPAENEGTEGLPADELPDDLEADVYTVQTPGEPADEPATRSEEPTYEELMAYRRRPFNVGTLEAR